jgi:uncharacterized protein (TIGR03435 family)
VKISPLSSRNSLPERVSGSCGTAVRRHQCKRGGMATLIDRQWAQMSRMLVTLIAWSLAGISTSAQQPSGVEFDVVSIKRNPGADAGGTRTSPDGSFTMTNGTVRSIITALVPEPVVDVVGLPEWARTERYDIIAKAPSGATRAQQGEMMRAMLVDRLKVQAHVEQQERDTFALVLARSDGRLGPQLKPSTLDCVSPPTPPQSGAPPVPLSTSDMALRCGMSMSPGKMVSGGVTMDRLVLSLPTNGIRVFNRTGLQGYYAMTLTFSRPRGAGAQPSLDEPPEIFTAVQEQLGLKLVPEKALVPVLVIDHIERPTPD